MWPNRDREPSSDAVSPHSAKPQPTRRAGKLISGILRHIQLKIGIRLTLSFITIVLLTAAGYAVAVWQFHEIRVQEQELDRAHQKSEAVLNLHSHLFALRDKLENLADAKNGGEFVREANMLRKSLQDDVERVKQALNSSSPDIGRDPLVLVSLDAVESALPVQIDAMSDLAKAEDWSAIRLRSQNQIKQLSYLTSSLVDKVVTEVSEERARVRTSTQLGERRAWLMLVGSGSVTLLVAAALGLFVTRSITSPLVILDRGAQALASGDFHHEVVVAGKDELADLGSVFNHTARRLRELYETLQESEARFRSLIEHSSDFIVVLDGEGIIRYVSPSTERALGLESDDLVGESIFAFIHPDDLKSARSAINDRTPNVIRTFEFRYQHPEGQSRMIEAMMTNLLDVPAVAGLVVNARDITERKRAEEELRRSEAFLAEGERLSHTGSWAWTFPSDEVTWSPEHFRIMGYEFGKTKPRLELFWERVHPEDRPRVRQVMEKAILEKSDVATEFRIVLSDGSIRYIRGVSRAVVSESGQLVEFVGTSMDITERKRAEDALQQAQAELAHVARVATMGELTASIAHEVSQPLTGIIVNATAGLRFLAAEQTNLARVQEMLERIVRDGHWAGAVVSRIRALIKKSPPGTERLDINEIIMDVVALAGSELRGKKVALETQLPHDLPLIFGDRVQLQQVILNLIVNAIEAMCATDGPRELLVKSEKDRSAAVIVTVRDSGPGLDSANLHQIFDAFYTTKPKGMGMGLAISRSIIEAHGGRLYGIPNAGRGATFQFTLPVGEDRALSKRGSVRATSTVA
jgi:PAS domain S-box-containing protein